MVYGKTGRFPIYINLYSRIISNCAKLLSDKDNKIVNVLCKFQYTHNWNDTIKITGSNVFI